MKSMKIIGVFLIVIMGAFLGSASTYGILKLIESWKGKLPADEAVREEVFDTNTVVGAAATENAGTAVTESRRNAIVEAARKVGPATVSISVTQTQVYRQTNPGFGADFWDFFFYGPREYRRKTHSLGSGIIINPEGYILTNDHVVRGAEEITITLTSGEQFNGKLIGSDETTDLAVLRIMSSRTDFPYARLGNSDNLIIGEWAIAIGNPFGFLLDDPNPTVTVGVISATNRDIRPEAGFKQVFRNMIQTDAAINPGNSGGPLVNAFGEVIGINTFIFSSSRGSEGIGFAIPVNRAKTILADLIKTGQVVKSWVGMKVQRIDQQLIRRFGLSVKTGLAVLAVDDMSPAQKAGVRPADVPLSINGRAITRESDWAEIINFARIGEPLTLKILRGQDTTEIQLVPEAEPTQSAPSFTDMFGLNVIGITRKVASFYGIQDDRGVLIASISPNGPAKDWGFQEGDIIRGINRRPITSLDDYKNISNQLRRGYQVLFIIERQGELYYLAVVT